ncbi:MAG: hypothetical protein JSV37_13910 [Anaerolineaceae bacterium]|nr:MAG: hypothetical protein JSV37_13910 [Anaerolineaceae bacterium]
MAKSNHRNSGYLLAATLGAFVGGAIVLVASRALPKMMSQMMSSMMRNMMEQMGGEGCNPSDI